MTRFLDGPAEDWSTALARSPILLRVVYDVKGDRLGALESLESQVLPDQAVYVYQRTTPQGSVDHEYRFLNPQPPGSVTRSNAEWRDWAADVARQMSVAGGRL